MKKILSLTLVLTMVLTMSVTAFAAEIDMNTNNKTGSTEITYTVSDSYVVTIPDSMTVGTNASVSVSNVTIAKGYDLAVSVSSNQYNNGWKLKNNDDAIGYSLKINNEAVANNGTVLTAESGVSTSITLVTALAGNKSPKYSGSYTDTLTFSVAVEFIIDAAQMSATDLQNAITEELASGKTGIKIKMATDADSTAFDAIRSALSTAQDPISLTIYGAKTIPANFIGEKSIGGVKQSAVDKVSTLNLPDAETIERSAFYGCKALESVTAPKLETVGELAFVCAALTAVNFPKVTTVECGAFEACSDLTTVKLPSATSIGEYAFHLCAEIESLELTAAGTITLGTSMLTDDDGNNNSTNVNLVLNTDKQNEVTGNTWNGYTFKSITFEN